MLKGKQRVSSPDISEVLKEIKYARNYKRLVPWKGMVEKPERYSRGRI